jgi:hypothetical protein
MDDEKKQVATCPWNEYGATCGKPGWMSTATNGDGPFYCSTHFWRLLGQPERVGGGESVTYREQWYRDRKRDYEPPKTFDLPPFQCVGNIHKIRAAQG